MNDRPMRVSGGQHAPNARRLMQAMSEAMQLIDQLPDDERLRHDTIEGETQALECMDAYAEQALADRELVNLARRKIARLEARIDRNRDIVAAILRGLQLPKVERPLYTVSLSQRTEVVEAPTNEELPTAFIRSAPDKALISKALRNGETVPGYQLQERDEATLLVRTG